MAQSPFAGNYSSNVNGDNISLNLEDVGTNRLNGKLKDSQQTYYIDATTSGKKISGTATENTMGFTIQLNGFLEGSSLELDMTMSLLGQTETQRVVFVKQNSSSTTSHSKSLPTNNTIPAGANRDPELVGKWQQSDTYTSGSGGNFFSGTSISNIIFLENGTLADGGSQSTMSGSNYYGNSGMSSAQIIPNVVWYTKNQHIFLLATENGQSQTIDVGKYYIENGNMLITATNGKKVLLTKQ